MLGESNDALDVVAVVVPGTISSEIKTRFSLAAFYYSTGGDSSWAERFFFLSSDHVCDSSKEQVICDEADEDIELNLGKCIV